MKTKFLVSTLLLGLGLFLFLIKPGETWAQSCGGQVTCCNSTIQVCNPTNCDPFFDDPCTCSNQCGTLGSSWLCGWQQQVNGSWSCVANGPTGPCPMTQGSCFTVGAPPPPSGTPPPGGGGGGACGWCASNPQCSNSGGTAVANSGCSNGFCCTGVSGGGGGGAPPPPPPPPKSCGESCSNDAECRNPSPAGNPVACRNGRCENTACAPGFTVPGANCDCSVSNRSCGQTCGSSVGLCASGSSCTFVNIGNTGNACIPGGTQTYCAGSLNGYSRPLCTAGDTGNSYLLGPGGKTTGFTADEILASCGGAPGSVRPIGVPNRVCGELCGYSGVAAYGITLIESLCATGVCRYVNEPAAGNCPFSAALSTYCVGTSNGYTNPQCTSGDTGGAYLRSSTGQTTGLTQAQINASCGGLAPTPVPTLPPAGVPVVDLRANNSNGPLTVLSGTAVTLTWTASGSTSLSASGGWSGSKTVPSGTQTTGPLTANTTFTLTGVGPGGTRSDSVVVNVTPPPTCTVSVPSPIEIIVGESRIITATTTAANGSITQVNFVSASPAVATVTTPANSSPFRTTVYGASIGSTTVTVTAFMGAGPPRCTTTATINVIAPAAWWQAGSGDVYAGAGVTSLIPATCLTPACEPYALANATGGNSGVLISGSGLNVFGNGSVSSSGWLANTSYAGRNYDYPYFDSLVPSEIKANSAFNLGTGSVSNPSTFNTSGVLANGYRWIRRQGNLSIDTNVNFAGNDKIILFVDGDLTINGRINLQNQGQNFFITIVRGNIRVAGSVTNGNNPALQGIYCVGGNFQTGASTNRLIIRGAVVGGNILLERDLVAGNVNTPAERVDFAPELMLLYPPQLSARPVIWREVAP